MESRARTIRDGRVRSPTRGRGGPLRILGTGARQSSASVRSTSGSGPQILRTGRSSDRAESRGPNSRPQQERRSLDRTPCRDDGPGPHAHGDAMGTVAERGLDAPDFAALDDEMIRFRVEQEPGPGAVRVREIRHEGGLLRIVDAAEETEVTATAAAVRVPGDDVVIDAEPVPEGLAPAAQHIVRGIHGAFLDVHVEAAPHLV